MTDTKPLIERAREIAAQYPPRDFAEVAPLKWKSSVIAGIHDNGREMRMILAALTLAQVERDAVIEECAKVAEATPIQQFMVAGAHKYKIAAAIRALADDPAHWESVWTEDAS